MRWRSPSGRAGRTPRRTAGPGSPRVIHSAAAPQKEEPQARTPPRSVARYGPRAFYFSIASLRGCRTPSRCGAARSLPFATLHWCSQVSRPPPASGCAPLLIAAASPASPDAQVRAVMQSALLGALRCCSACGWCTAFLHVSRSRRWLRRAGRGAGGGTPGPDSLSASCTGPGGLPRRLLRGNLGTDPPGSSGWGKTRAPELRPTTRLERPLLGRLS